MDWIVIRGVGAQEYGVAESYLPDSDIGGDEFLVSVSVDDEVMSRQDA